VTTAVCPGKRARVRKPQTSKKDHARKRRYHARKPWVRHVCWANRRCTSDDPRWRAHYLDRGITCDVTAAQAEFMWHRDGAAKMVRPSLDREKSELNYTLSNCRFMEFDVNSRRAWDPKVDADEARAAVASGAEEFPAPEFT